MQTVQNIAGIVNTLLAAGTDVILMVSNPINYSSEVLSSYGYDIAQYTAAIYALATGQTIYNVTLTKSVGVIDLSSTYDDFYSQLNNAGLMGDALHPDATLYADIGSQIGNLLTAAVGIADPTLKERLNTLKAQRDEAKVFSFVVVHMDHDLAASSAGDIGFCPTAWCRSCG